MSAFVAVIRVAVLLFVLSPVWIAGPTAAQIVTPPAIQPVSRTWMLADEMLAEFSGIRLAGIYPSKIEWAEDINPDGTTLYEEGAERRPGRWNATGELLCFVYAEPRQGGCFRIVKHSANCYELYTASIGGVAPPVPPPAETMAWNGRMWRAKLPQTCDEKPMS